MEGKIGEKSQIATDKTCYLHVDGSAFSGNLTPGDARSLVPRLGASSESCTLPIVNEDALPSYVLDQHRLLTPVLSLLSLNPSQFSNSEGSEI